jgi:hypothetical protein
MSVSVSTCATKSRSPQRDYRDSLPTLRAADPVLAAEVERFNGIRDVLLWMQQRNLSGAAVDIVGQDEFHYDFLIQFEPQGRWIAFGVT